jgi:DNA-binding transcriptional ArsR family regulator
MRELGIKGTPSRRLPRGARLAQVTSLDLVRRVFVRDCPNKLWLMGITEHPTNEGKLYCCVVLDTFSRRVVGWAIESTQTTILVLNALGMATQRREGRDGLIVHSDRGTQGGFNRSSQRSMREGCDGKAGWVDDAVDGSGGDEVAGQAVAAARCGERVLAADRGRLNSEEAALAVGASQAAGSRWFRDRGGMPTFMVLPLSGRYLRFEEREEIARLRAQGLGIRDIARRISLAPSTVSRELRRNAATRGGKLEYRASVAQWKAELMARPPKTAKLAADPRLREYVQDRLSGAIARPDGSVVGARRSRGEDAVTDLAKIGAGARHGALSRSLTASVSSSPIMSRCASLTRRSIKRSTWRAGVRCGAN